jgi:hypothetical protein
MKKNNVINHGVKLLAVFLLILTQSTVVLAKNKDCWVDLFDDTQYQGNQIHISGPAKLKNLMKVKGENWDKRIESTIVGPKATLTVFENKGFKLTLAEMANHPVLMKSLGISKQDILEESELIFGANSKVHGFGEFHFYHKIRSLKVDCVK